MPSPSVEVLERKSQADAAEAREDSKIVWPKPDLLDIERISRTTRGRPFRPPPQPTAKLRSISSTVARPLVRRPVGAICHASFANAEQMR